ncbi:MAG: hypothetical protein RI991_508 [Bacteroidota bacterium]
MKKRILFFFISILFFSYQVYSQQNNFWKEHGIGILSVGKAASRTNFPSNYKLFDANLSRMRAYLNTALRGNLSNIIISLPNADGGIEEFEIKEASNFEPQLQSKFREIRSFAGKGITDKNARLRLSISPHGIQTMILRDGKEEEYIEPYTEDKLTYAVFKSQRSSGQLPWNCYTQDQQITSALNQIVTDLPIGIASSGGNLKVLRLALSCNGEYANYFGAMPTTSDRQARVLAAFNATLTRCNAIFEKDLAIHLELIPASTNVIYYNPATDPYSPTLSLWNSQLQTTLTNIIGEGNYDIGHMFGSTGGGGNAGCIGCVCNTGKGSGITSPADGIPQGDNFDIDYVAHEIGHQLGANHTFSMNTEGTGVHKEVGSGITIMSYAGITAQDVAPHSIDIFHQASIEQIQNNIATKTCGSTFSITSTNATPVVAPLTNYTIPISTPFFLTGSATDANGDALTYCWEQNDNSTTTGTASIASEAKTTGPNWISFRPTSSPTRYFPQLSTILAGGNVTGPLPGGDIGANIEALSSVARTLNFRLTVRDNAPFSSTLHEVGQTSFADVVITVHGTAGPFAVTAPNTNVSWGAGTTQNVTWSVNRTNLAPINCANVKISLSTDGGQTFPIVLSESTPNDGLHPVTLPNNLSTTARIKIEAVGNIFFDISNTNFTITSPALCGSPTGLTSSPITATSANISWTAVPNVTSYLVEYKLNSATTWTVVNATQTTTTASLTGLTASTAYDWRVTANCSAGSGTSVSSNFTTLVACGNPTGLTSSGITTNSVNLSWSPVVNATSYSIEYRLNTTTTWTVLNATQTTTTASLTGLNSGSAYNWRVRANCPAGSGAYISASFTTTTIGVVTSCQNSLDNDLNGTLAGAAIIPFNTNVTGLISPASDIDYYKFTITTGGRITVSLTTLPADYNIRLRNSAGIQVAIAARTGTRNESFNYTAVPGIYYVEVYGANAAANNATRCYTLRVASGTAARNIPVNTTNTDLTLNVGTSTEGSEAAQEVQLYPNPISNELLVKLIAIDGKSVIEVFDLTGKQVSTTTVNTIAGTINTVKVDMSRNAKGIYLVRITNNETIIHQSKIVKQ